MANPVFIDIEKDEWTLVAAGVCHGQVTVTLTKPELILHTYRMAGSVDLPINPEEGIPFSSKSAPIISSDLIDVYIYARCDNGQIRLDI